MAKIGQSRSVAVSYVGKLKTVFQMAAILLLLLFSDPVFHVLPVMWIGTALIYAAAFLTLWSMAFYLRKALPLAAAGDRPES